MKAKTIKAVLRKKCDEWIDTIEDPNLQATVRRDAIITGGAVASMLLREPVNDYDVYFRTHDTAFAVAKYYIERFRSTKRAGIECKISVQSHDGRIRCIVKSAGIASENGTDKPYEYFEARPEGEGEGYVGELMDDPGEIEDKNAELETLAQQTEGDGKPPYRPVFVSTNAITLSHRIQLVLRFYGEPNKIHENYDFVHCMNYWTSHNNELVLRPAALESLLTKELRYVGSVYPVCSVIRLRKFMQRGWTINAGQILKMLMQISDLDLHDVNVLQDQLTGVDAAYFCELLQKIKENDPEKVNTAYLVEIIDRMF